jgi:hypothetical protein
MTTDTKLEFADWLLVRDTVAHEIEDVNSDGAMLHDRQIAEALMAQGWIDIDAVLADERGEELDADNYIEVDALADFHPTHWLSVRGVTPVEEMKSAPVEVIRQSEVNLWARRPDGRIDRYPFSFYDIEPIS